MEKKKIKIIIVIGIITAASVSSIIALLFFGTGQIVIETYEREKCANGTTLFTDLSLYSRPRIIEVTMEGKIIWEYYLPDDLKDHIEPGFDVEHLPNNNILFVAPQKGIYEIDRKGVIIWSYLDSKVSHDADRLKNGNTLIVWGGSDTKSDAQVKEVNKNGQIVWTWYAKDHYDRSPYDDISKQGWTHVNAATRLSNGNTMISLRNFNLTAIVSKSGKVLKEVDWSKYGNDPHEPEIQPNGNILVAMQSPDRSNDPYNAVEVNSAGKVVWMYGRDNTIFARDCDRLSNGNTLIVAVVNGRSKIFEVTPTGEIVWELAIGWKHNFRYSPGWFYKSQRIER